MIEFHDVYTTPGATQILWDLMLERAEEHEVNISFSMPSMAEHEAYIRRTPYPLWYLAVAEDDWIGYVYTSWLNEIGIWVFRQHRGRGYGPKMLKMFLSENSPLPGIPGQRASHFIANIHPKNERSIHMFREFGFKHIQNTFSYEP